jgi:NTP pyrophosphatase (non-canonical NTP hydrolase)
MIASIFAIIIFSAYIIVGLWDGHKTWKEHKQAMKDLNVLFFRESRSDTLDGYQQAVLRTANTTLPNDQKMSNFALGMAGEAGEVADLCKKVLFHGHSLDKDKLAKELGDCLWYAAALSNLIGFTLSDIAKLNVEKLKTRYPEGFSKEASINRKE